MATALESPDLAPMSPIGRARAIHLGLPVKMIKVLLADGEIGINDLARVVAPRRTLERRLKDGERLTADESDKLARFMTILALCEHIFGDRREAMGWLRDSLWTFDDECPIDMLRTSAGGDAVNNLLQRSRHGMLA